jgi:hypothetical protein
MLGPAVSSAYTPDSDEILRWTQNAGISVDL